MMPLVHWEITSVLVSKGRPKFTNDPAQKLFDCNDYQTNKSKLCFIYLTIISAPLNLKNRCNKTFYATSGTNFSFIVVLLHIHSHNSIQNTLKKSWRRKASFISKHRTRHKSVCSGNWFFCVFLQVFFRVCLTM